MSARVDEQRAPAEWLLYDSTPVTRTGSSKLAGPSTLQVRDKDRHLLLQTSISKMRQINNL